MLRSRSQLPVAQLDPSYLFGATINYPVKAAYRHYAYALLHVLGEDDGYDTVIESKLAARLRSCRLTVGDAISPPLL